MAKILLAEDDANLREIFEMRLKAEGFEVVTAGDGEEALVVATKEMPDLIVVDIMMPKISGFEMLETLRTNPSTAQIKAIMMTALGQAEDRERGAKLGVLKYLVKSQVTLEDFVRTVKEVLGVNQSSNQTRSNMDDQTPKNPMPNNPTPAEPSTSTPPMDNSMPASAPALPADEQTTGQETSDVKDQVRGFADSPTPAPDADQPAPTPPAEMGTAEPAPVEASTPVETATTSTDPVEPADQAKPGDTVAPDGTASPS